MPKPKIRTPLCTFAIPNFPRKLKAKYAAYCRANDIFIKDHLQYLVAKELREARVEISPLMIDTENDS